MREGEGEDDDGVLEKLLAVTGEMSLVCSRREEVGEKGEKAPASDA